MEVEADVCAEVLSHLELLASLDLQAKYERDVKVADVPAELVSIWFDDLDLPASAPKLFVGEDLRSVQAFSDLLEKTSKDLEGLTLSELHAHSSWLLVTESARKTLQRLQQAV